MRISVFGLGHVGAVCAACLADKGHAVVGVDKSGAKLELVRSGRSPVVEPELDDLVRRTVAANRLAATGSATEAVAKSDLSLICVGTPTGPTGELRLDAIESVIEEIARGIAAKGRPHTVVVRSTVVPGTTRGLVAARLSAVAGGAKVGVAFNPEFLREGSAVGDFRNPAKTVVGALDEGTASEVMSLYGDLPGAKITTELEVAELAKYADNTWHALKVAFANEIGAVAQSLGLGSHAVMAILLADTRLNISAAYLRPGFAFGGSCLPKDLRALARLASTQGLSLPVIDHVLDSNRLALERGAAWIASRSGRRVALLGISFKAGTDDVRESPFVALVARLIRNGIDVRIFDANLRPAELIGANREFLLEAIPNIAELMAPSAMDAIRWADTVVVTVADATYTTAVAQWRTNQTILDISGRAWEAPSGAPVRDILCWP
ncbi:MAG TPA: nucleotide sugar dehydrogenase [Xanthobacteraceae bacterium]